MNEITEKTIDVRAILGGKMGAKAKYVPGFVVRWLERILHQDEVNDFLWQNRNLQGVPWLESCLEYLGTKLDIVGEENMPDDGDGRLYTFVSNHPLGGQDGVALGAILGRHYGGRFRYLVNDLLMNLPGLAPLCVPINKTGRQSRNFPAMVEACFKGDNHVIMFLPWKKTFVTKSVETHRDVVPVHFGGHNSDFFYNLANVCKRLGIKFNIAMLYLADEMYKNRDKTFRVAIGKPIPWQTFDKSKTPAQWAQYVQDIVYKL